jgi:hypothetical protein
MDEGRRGRDRRSDEPLVFPKKLLGRDPGLAVEHAMSLRAVDVRACKLVGCS